MYVLLEIIITNFYRKTSKSKKEEKNIDSFQIRRHTTEFLCFKWLAYETYVENLFSAVDL